MIKLKNCPFCGGKAVIIDYDDGRGNIQCGECEFTPLLKSGWDKPDGKQKAITWWNIRKRGKI